MTRHVLGLSLLMAAMAAGCSYDGKAAAAKAERETAKQSAPSITYAEVPYEGRIYVVSTVKAADDVKKGVLPPIAVTKIGAGPKRETVVFEANKAYVEDTLVAEFNKRNGTKIK